MDALLLRERLGAFLNRRGVPGPVMPMFFDDPVTGNRIEIEVTPLRTVLTVSGRDYTFDRLTGDFVGTGMGCRKPAPGRGKLRAV